VKTLGVNSLQVVATDLITLVVDKEAVEIIHSLECLV